MYDLNEYSAASMMSHAHDTCQVLARHHTDDRLVWQLKTATTQTIDTNFWTFAFWYNAEIYGAQYVRRSTTVGGAWLMTTKSENCVWSKWFVKFKKMLTLQIDFLLYYKFVSIKNYYLSIFVILYCYLPCRFDGVKNLKTWLK